MPQKPDNYRFRITAPHFIAAEGELRNWRVRGDGTHSDIKFMHNWSWKEVVEYCEHKGWKLEKVK